MLLYSSLLVVTRVKVWNKCLWYDYKYNTFWVRFCVSMISILKNRRVGIQYSKSVFSRLRVGINFCNVITHFYKLYNKFWFRFWVLFSTCRCQRNLALIIHNIYVSQFVLWPSQRSFITHSANYNNNNNSTHLSKKTFVILLIIAYIYFNIHTKFADGTYSVHIMTHTFLLYTLLTGRNESQSKAKQSIILYCS